MLHGMHGKIQSVLYLLISSFMTGGTALCTHGSYLNLCGYCVGGRTGKSDLEGLDRCGICSGQSDCVGCDGIINSPRRRDTCGLCLPPNSEQWNDCRKIQSVYPPVLDLSVDGDLLPLTIIGAGLSQSDMKSTQCHFFPLESQPESPSVREISLEETEIQIKVTLGKAKGMYKIGCSEIEGFAQLRIVDSRRINVINVRPSEVLVDEAVELEMEIGEDRSGNANGTYWCFLKKKGGEAESFRATRISGTNVKCSEYTTTTPGIFYVGVVAREDAATGENTTGRTAELISRAKPPIPETASYSPDLQNIAVMFDQNIKIPDCNRTFSPDTEKSLGEGFICSSVADKLYIVPGQGHNIVESLTIIGVNSIQRDGSSDADLSPNTAAVTIPVSKHEVITPRFTLSFPNVICADKTQEPVINVKVSKLGKRNLNYIWVTPPSREWKGRSQRENMLMWKRARAVEAELNNKSHAEVFSFNRTSLQRSFNYILNLRSNDTFGNNHAIVRTLPMPEEGNLSITVMTFPSASVIAAEVKVVFCADRDRSSLLYQWKVDDRVVSEEGKLLIIPQMSPGIYNISCVVYSHETKQILGTGWSTTEVVQLPQPVTIFPADIVIGVMDDFTLEAHTSEAQFRWSCKTAFGEPCITVGPRADSIEDIVDIMSPTVRIPSRTLPVGRYIWTLNEIESATAAVTIAPSIPPRIKVIVPQRKIDSTAPLSLSADVERLKSGCRIKWKTIHKKGFHYFDIQEDVGLGDMMEVQVDDSMIGEREVPLLIPPARGKWKGLTGGAMYLFRLQTVCPDPTPDAHIDVTVTVNAPPSGTNFQITPESGNAVNTKFTITITEGSDSIEDYPFIYRISYHDGSDEVQMGVSVLKTFSLILPPGNVTVTVKNCDIWNSCSKSSKLVTIKETSDVTSEIVKYLSQDIRSEMVSGDTLYAYGKAITMFKSLSLNEKDKEKLDEILSTTESAIRDRLRDLSERVLSDPKLVKQSFEFLEQSVMSLKFFPDTKELLTTLTEFKNLITKRATSNREKRETTLAAIEKGISFTYKDRSRKLERSVRDTSDVKINENSIKAIFDLHAKVLEQNNTENNKREFLKDVKKYMIESCEAIQDSLQGPVLIESSIITLEIMKLTQNQMKKDLPITVSPNSKFRLNFKSVPRKTCIAVAKYGRNFLGIANMLRVTDVYEVRLIKNGTFQDTDIKSLVIALPLTNIHSHEVVNCMTWNKESWKVECSPKQNGENVIICDCKGPGIIAAFTANETNQSSNGTVKSVINSEMTMPLFNTAIVSTTPMVAPAINTTAPNITLINVNFSVTATSVTTTNPILVINFNKSSDSSVINLQSATLRSTPMVGTPKTETITITSTSKRQDVDDVRGNNKTLYISGTFLIEEDYNATVGKNEVTFKNSLKMQLAEQLSISENVIANLIISPGSIFVTVLFVDTEETKAEAAIQELYTKLQDGNLRLTSLNTTLLRVPQQILKVRVGTAITRNTEKMRLITYGIVTGTLIAILIFALGATYFKRKRTQMPLRVPRLSIDDHPTYRQFHNEFSLDGSPATLERYRRDHPFETEIM